MAIALSISSYTSFSSVLSSTVKFRYSLSHTHRPITSLHYNRSNPDPLSSSSKPNRQKEGVGQKKQSEQSKDERPTRGNVVKSFGIPRKDKDFVLDAKDQQVEPSNLQDSAFLNAVVK
ncbi:Protease Do-like 2, chloroplastic, partial [Sesbania bispinosa]